MHKKDRSFLITGLISGSILGLCSYFNGFRWVPFLAQLTAKPGGVGAIAKVVFWFVLWVGLSLLARFFRTRREMGVLATAEPVVQKLGHHAWIGDVDSYLRSAFRRSMPTAAEFMENLYIGSRLCSRLRLIQDRLADANRSDRVSFLLSGRSGIEAAHNESFYGLLRALIWAMPGLGFMGTALEMAHAVGGMGTSLKGTADYGALRNLLAGEVIPHLAGAFDITLFALGGSVACFLLLAIVHRQDEDVLNASDSLSLILLSKIADAPPEDEPARAATDLEEEIEKLRTGLTVVGSELSKLNTFVDRSSNTLRTIFNHP